MPGKFQEKWLQDPRFKEWVVKPPEEYKFRCKPCAKTLCIAEKYEQALTQHSRSPTHLEKLDDWRKLGSAKLFCKSANNAAPAATEVGDNGEKTGMMDKLQTHMDRKRDAEVLWTMQNISEGASYRRFDRDAPLLRRMFSQDPITQKPNQFTLCRTKGKYICEHRISPYLQETLDKLVEASPYIGVSEDGTFNKTLKKEQVDYAVRLWNKDKGETEDYFYTSDFIGHKRHQDLIKSYESSTKNLPAKKIVNLGLDHVKSNDLLKDDIQAKRELLPNAPSLIDTGPCLLHGINNACKNSADAVGLGVRQFLEGADGTFNKSSSRPEDLETCFPPGKAKLPLPFCTTRWLENEEPAKRMAEIYKPLQQWAANPKFLPKRTTQAYAKLGKSVKNLIEGLENDPLMEIKLQWFIQLSKYHDYILRVYQQEGPMMPMVVEDVSKLFYKLLAIVMERKPLEKLNDPHKLLTVMPENSEAKKAKDMEFGYMVEQKIADARLKKTLTEKDEVALRRKLQDMIWKYIEYVQENTPVGCKVVEWMDSLNPHSINAAPLGMKKLFLKLLQRFDKIGVLTQNQAAAAKEQYGEFIQNVLPLHRSDFRDYDPLKQRLDKFWFSIIGDQANYEKFKDLWSVLICCFICYASQAKIERGFSENTVQLQVNAEPKNIIHRRRVKDFSNKIEDLSKYELPEELKRHVKLARQRYQDELEENRKKAEDEAVEAPEAENVELTPAEKKVQLERDIKKLVEKIDAGRDEMDRLVELNAKDYKPETNQEQLTLKRKCDEYKETLKVKRAKLESLK